MNIKSILFALLLLPLTLMAETTTDRLSIAAATLQPGGAEVKVTVSLEGSRLYTGYEMDITLPEGVELNYYRGKPDVSRNGIYPYDEDRDENKIYSHTVNVTYGEIGDKVVRIACSSSKNENFTDTNGSILVMYLKATPYAKPGAVTLGLSNCKFATYDNSTQTTTGYTVTQSQIEGITIGTSATCPVSVGATTNWSTCVLPFSADVPAGVEAYTCDSKDGSDLILRKAESLAAFTPYILYSEAGYNGNLTGTVTNYPETTTVSAGYLNAALAPQQVSSGYVLAKQNGVVKFYQVNPESPATIPAGKCWVTLPADSQSKGLGLRIENATAAQAPSAVSAETTGGYTLGGASAVNAKKGEITVVKGKKFVR